MYCNKCGNQIREGNSFCRNCGNRIGTQKNKVAIICIIAAIAVFAVVLVLFLGTDIFSRADKPVDLLETGFGLTPDDDSAFSENTLLEPSPEPTPEPQSVPPSDEPLPPDEPVLVPSVEIRGTATTIAAGGDDPLHGASFVIRHDGSLWAWGNNSRGQLGDGTTTVRHDPVWIMDDVIAVAAGGSHTMAIRSDSSLWAWGANWYGELGNGTTAHSYNPVQIMDDVVAVAAGGSHTMAIRSDGSLWAWGWNDFGQLGDGTTTNRHSPVQIMDDVIAVACGLWHTMAIKSDGSLLAWGSNRHGALGDGTATIWDITGVIIEVNDRRNPVQIMDDVVAVAGSGIHTTAIRSDGSLWAWGLNDLGQLGDGTTTDRHSPVRIMDDVIAVACGLGHTMAIRSDGSLWTWGSNWGGQLGDGTTTIWDRDVRVIIENNNRHSPVRIMDDVLAVTGGSWHTMAIKSDGSLWTWGSNETGQLGDGTAIERHSPVWIMDDIMQ